jgi:hypothetical protein
MALAHSPRIVTDGLVFYYDMGNSLKSWKGAPTVNLQDPNFNNWSYTVILQELSELSPAGTTVYSVTDNSTGSYLALTRNITVPNDSNIYTISIYIKKTYGATSARLGFNSGFTGGTTLVQLNQRFNSDTGVGNTGTTQDLGDWWRWQFQLTNNSTGNTTLYCSFFPATGFYNSSDNAAATGTAISSAIQIEQNSFATPFVNGTRSNTQAILDLTNNNTITATSLTYSSNGTFSYNGSTNYTTVSNAISAKTIIAWVKLSTAAGGDYIVYGLDANGADNWFGINANRVYFFGTQTSDVNNFAISGTTTISTTNYCQIVCTIDGSTAKVFLNGLQENVITNAFTIGEWNTAPTIGRRGTISSRYFPGNIDCVSVYDKVLSQSEIQQNFNALRGRFGI